MRAPQTQSVRAGSLVFEFRRSGAPASGETACPAGDGPRDDNAVAAGDFFSLAQSGVPHHHPDPLALACDTLLTTEPAEGHAMFPRQKALAPGE